MNKDALELEKEVQRIATLLWGKAPGDALPAVIDGKERDCVYWGEEVIHYIECTLQRALAKVESDGKKMVAFRDAEMRKGNVVKLWYVTAYDPTADQVSAAKRLGIKILSLHNFKMQLFDGESYLRIRKNYRWGSATDPRNESSNIEDVTYQRTNLYGSDGVTKQDIDGVATLLSSKKIVTLLGDYGMGKSLSVREVFRKLAARYDKSSSSNSFPIAINLRDHWGQDDPAEVLTRHCMKIGFEKPAQLIRAYHAGEITLLLDGFDEIVGIPVANRRELKRLRSEALTVVRRFLADLRGKAGVLVAGRQNFFDTDSERNAALGTLTTDTSLDLQEMSSEEADQMLRRFQVFQAVPSWLPRRPLFLAYLASQGFLSDLQKAGTATASQSWDRLIDAICEREKRINEGLDASSIRGILELLADGTRATASGRGPIHSDDILRAYKQTTGYEEPDEHYRPLLMRLPGLTTRNNEDGSREFIDDSMLNSLRAPMLAHYASLPYADPHAKDWKHGVSSLGLEVAYERLLNGEVTFKRVLNAAREAAERWSCHTLAADLLRLAQRLAPESETLQCNLLLENAKIEELDLFEHPCTNLVLAGCELGTFVLPASAPQSVFIRDCLVDKVLGLSKQQAVPAWIENTEIGDFDPSPTNASILVDAQLAIPHRVLLTIFRKLYVQPGSGRLEGALVRGLPDNYRPYVSPTLDLLRSKGFASLQTARQQRIWFSERARTNEVLQMLNDYATSVNPLVAEVKKLRV